MKSGRIRLLFVVALSLFFGAIAATIVFAGSPPAPPALPTPPLGVLLSAWNFNDTNWLSSRGYAPLSFTNIDNIDDWDRNALQVDNSDPAWLAYKVVENDGHTNLTCDRGTISFWFIPNWESTNIDSGTGPGNWAQLIDVGRWTSNATYGWWSLYLNPAGTGIYFSAQTNGAGMDYFGYSISWDWNTWHLITLTYSSTNTLLYLDGQMVTNGAGVMDLPPDAVLTNGFFIGSDNQGVAQAHGLFEDLRTYSYQLDATIVSNYYAGILPELPSVGGFSMDSSSPPSPGDGGGSGSGTSGLGSSTNGPASFGTNLVLQITNAVNSRVSGILHNTTQLTPYTIFSKQSLFEPVWNPQMTVYGQLLTNFSTFDFSMVARPNLFFRAQANIAPRILARGNSHSVVVYPDGTVWSWGDNSVGQLGNGTWDNSFDLVQAKGISNIVAVSANNEGDFTVALDSSGKVWAWGDNGSGQLGLADGGYNNTNCPASVVGLSNIVSIGNGYFHTVALRSDGTVWTWGDSYHGILGDDSTTSRDHAARIPSLSNVVSIAVACFFNFALDQGGRVWGWGDGDGGVLGVGNYSVQPHPILINSMTNVIGFSGGDYHSLLELADGTVKASGQGGNGQLGDGSNGEALWPVVTYGLSNIIAVSCGDNHSMALNTAGQVFMWGGGNYGQLGTGANWDTNRPTRLNSISNVIAITGGYLSSLALTADGSLYEWGYDSLNGSNYAQPFLIETIERPVVDASNVSAYFPYPVVNTNEITANISGGPAAAMAILINSTNFASAAWTTFNESPLINLGMGDGGYVVWFGFKGLNGIAYWSNAAIVLDTTPPILTITNPTTLSSLNASFINVRGNFIEANLKQITVNGVPVFLNGTNFLALNVPLSAGSNIVTAIGEDLAGNIGTASITIIGLTNTDGTLNEAVQLTATPVGGITPLPVTLQIQTNAPGIIQQVFYDFDGDGINDFATNNLLPITHTYTNGQYFPVATIQTTAGSFSSLGGWNSSYINRLRINVQQSVLQVATISVTDPVDLKWMSPSNLYVLSGSTATLTEFNTNGISLRSLSGLGVNPAGFDVDSAGNVYVAVKSSNQVWKLFPTTSSFQFDTNFGVAGRIGLVSGLSGTNSGQFNAPYDVAVSADATEISVSDSSNNRIQQFNATNGVFNASFGSLGSGSGQFNTPKGLIYDSVGALYIVDAGNNRIALSLSASVLGVTGTNGTALGQFNSPVNISVGKRGVYIADAGNNRIQCFDLLANGVYSFTSSDVRFGISTNLNQPAAVAALDNLTNEMFYVADTGNNRVLLYKAPVDDPTVAWNSMTNCIAAGDVTGAVSCFSSESADGYRVAFLSIGTNDSASDISQIGTLTPVFIKNDTAEYYFEQNIGGQTLLFTVEFVKENGIWKIFEF